MAGALVLTITLAPATLASGTLDQSNEATATGVAPVTGGNTHAWGQTFTAGLTGTLPTIDVYVNPASSPNANLVAGIYNITSGVPTGTALATASLTAASMGGGAWESFNFSNPTNVVSGNQYAIVFTSNASVGQYQLSSTANAYSGGTAFEGDLNAHNWLSYANLDIQFRTYVTTSDSGETPPPVLQQFGMPTSGTCDAAAPIVLNWGGAGSGGWGNSWAEWMNGGRGGAVCTRTLVYSNALGHWIVG